MAPYTRPAVSTGPAPPRVSGGCRTPCTPRRLRDRAVSVPSALPSGRPVPSVIDVHNLHAGSSRRVTGAKRPCSAVPAAPSLQHLPCSTILAAPSLQHCPCSAVPKAPYLQHHVCNAVPAVRDHRTVPSGHPGCAVITSTAAPSLEHRRRSTVLAALFTSAVPAGFTLVYQNHSAAMTSDATQLQWPRHTAPYFHH